MRLSAHAEPKSASGVPHLPLSLLNLPAPSFNPPHAYFASDFPWTEAAGWTDTGPVRGYSLAHFMSMSARLGYESHELIYRVVDLLWGCEVLGTGQQLSAASPVSWYAPPRQASPSSHLSAPACAHACAS